MVVPGRLARSLLGSESAAPPRWSSAVGAVQGHKRTFAQWPGNGPCGSPCLC